MRVAHADRNQKELAENWHRALLYNAFERGLQFCRILFQRSDTEFAITRVSAVLVVMSLAWTSLSGDQVNKQKSVRQNHKHFLCFFLREQN